MIIPRTSIGIEIAGPDIRIAVLRDFAGKRRLVRLDILPGFVGLSDEDRLTMLVTHFKRHKLSHFNVHLALPGTWGVSRDLEFPAVVGVADRLRSAVALQVESLSPWGLDEIYWDCAWQPAAKSAPSVVAHVGIVPRTILDPWIALFRSAGLALTGASLSSLSWAHGVFALWGTAHPVLVLSAEKEHIEGTLVQGDRINSIAASITPGGEGVAAAVQSAALQLVRSGRLGSIADVHLVVHGANGVDTGVESIRLPMEGAANAAGFGAISASLLGLVRSGFRANLIPAELRRRRNHWQLAPTYGLVTLLVALGVFAWMREPYQQMVYAEQLDREVQRLSPEVRSVADEETRLNRLSDQLKALDIVLHSRDANLEALRELARVLPSGTWLTGYQYQDNAVTLAGVSESAASIQKLIEDSPIFRDAQFTSSITRDSYGKDRFIIRAAIEVQR